MIFIYYANISNYSQQSHLKHQQLVRVNIHVNPAFKNNKFVSYFCDKLSFTLNLPEMSLMCF